MVTKTKSDRIRIAMLSVSEQIVGNTQHGWENRGSLVMQDDYRLLGFELYVAWAWDSQTPAYQEGEAWHTAVLARGAVTDQQSWLCQVTAAAQFWTEIVVATQLAGMYGNGQSDHEVVMFPAGHGVDLDEGEALNIHNTASALANTGADNMDLTAVAYLYLVER